MTAAYKYVPLSSPSAETRLLFLPTRAELNGTSDPISGCSIETVSLSTLDNVDFFAISYTWGDTSEKRALDLGGRSLAVPINTAHTLLAVRHHLCGKSDDVGTIRVWIDAVCINQCDLAERAQQVTLMREIYGQATEVLVCLGGDPLPGMDSLALPSVHAIFGAYMRAFNGSAIVPDAVKLPERAIHWRALADLFASPWFDRVWTVQEAVVAAKATCLFENASLPLYEALILLISFHGGVKLSLPSTV